MKKIVLILTLAVITVQAATAGTITGVVTKDSNGQPISGMWVYAQKYDTGEYCGGGTSNPDGLYVIGSLAAGAYKVGVSVSGSQYAIEFYNNQISWDRAAAVTVTAAEVTQNIDFSLELSASISGVVRNSSGIGQANVNVNCGVNNGYWTGDWTDANGFYKCDGLPVGYNYNVIAYPPSDSNYMITRIIVDVYQPGEYTDKDIVLSDGGFKISGKITDTTTTLPLANIRVGCWNDDFEIWADTRTDVNGIYGLTNLPSGNVDVQVQPDSYYAYTGVGDLELYESINNLDFALLEGATLCGKILDAQTAEPLADVMIEYSNERNSAYKNLFTDDDGMFCLTQLPPGIAEVKAEPDVDSGYAWNLPWGSNFVCLNEGENRSGQIIALEKGALVRGYIKDANGNAFSGIEYYYTGKKCDGWGDPDVNGFYQIRLPVGTCYIEPDDEEFGILPLIVTITDINEDVNVPDIIVYTEETGGLISGDVNNIGDNAKAGNFIVVAFETGTTFDDPNSWYAIQSIAYTEMENAEPFSFNNLPPDANYDIYLCVDNQSPDVESLTVRDSVLNVSIGTTNINLEYNSQGSTVSGNVENADGQPILGATVLLPDSLNSFGGFGMTDCNGQYIIYNVPAGTYTATAVHSKYLPISTTVAVVEGADVNAGEIIMPFTGEKEGPDLNGDGNIDMADVAEFAGQWLNTGANEANFNQDNSVDFRDWTLIAENWQDKAIWLNE
jgi:hypothetical protein